MRSILIGLLFCSITLQAQKKNAPSISRIDPPNWWVGMKDTTLQLLVYGKNAAAFKGVSISHPIIRIDSVHRVENSNYLFIDVTIPRNSIADTVSLIFTGEKKPTTWPYIFKEMVRPTAVRMHNGFDARDFVYLLMPDRFSNGDVTNDKVKGMLDQSLNRDSIFHRHGGDIQGIINHLDYLNELGVTAIWSTPLFENNQPTHSYHGYAYTDHYKIDPRFGSNQLYADYVKEAHNKNIKVVMDMVYNHVGSRHWFITDLPMKNWLNQWDKFTQTNYRATTLVDPYSSEYDRNRMSNGWFTETMPDLNQRNPYVARYLLQESIWWIESSGIDGFRIDTYTYSDLEFMTWLTQKIREQYPSFGLVGELWDHAVALQAQFVQRPKISGVPDNHLPGLTDFQLYHAINEALTKNMDWTGGLSRVYYTLMQDFLYTDATHNMLFLDNHDLSRFYSVIGEDFRKWKMGVAFLMTMRGIPSMYYGTEVLMKNFADPDGKVREDFKGGWPGDISNKFESNGRTDRENEAFKFVKTLASYHKSSEEINNGKLMQFVPEKDNYVYFRYIDEKAVMVILRYSDKPFTLDLSRFNEQLKNYTRSKDVITGNNIQLLNVLDLEPMSVRVIELSK